MGFQGAVAQTGSSGDIVLDDGSGRLAVSAGALPPDNPLPSLNAGDYVVVVGRLLPGDPANPGPEALSVKAAKVCLGARGLRSVLSGTKPQ